MSGKMAQQPQTFQLDTSGQHLKLVPVRSTTSQTERTTRESKKNSVRKIKTTTTSRHGSQKVVHVDTQIVETATASKGIVVLRRIPECSKTMVESGRDGDDELNSKRLESTENRNYEEGVSGDVLKLELIKGNKGERMRESKSPFYTTRDYFTEEDVGYKKTEEEGQNSLATNCKSFDESKRDDENIEAHYRNQGSGCSEMFKFHKERPLRQDALSDTFESFTSMCGEQSSRNTNSLGMALKPYLLDVNDADSVVKTSLLDVNPPDVGVRPPLDVNNPAVSETGAPDGRRSLDFGSIWAIGQLVLTERAPRRRRSCYRDYLTA